jgi:ATP-binding cassette subfamily G (WHITE) protein 1
MIKTYFFQSVFFAVLIGLIYLNLDEKKGASAVQDRTGVLYFLAINQVFSNAFGVLSIFGEEKGVFRREYGARYYSLPSYFLAKVSVELPFQFIFPILMGSIIYFMVGVQATVGKFLIFNGFLILCALCGFALGVCFGCIFTSLPVALAVTPLVLLPLMLFSGLLLNQGSIPVYVDWIKYIAPMKWGFSALAINEYSGLTIFTNSGTSISGEEIIRELALDDAYMTISTAAAVLSLMVIILMGLAYLALYRETIQASRTVKLVKSSFTAEIQHEEEETP